MSDTSETGAVPHADERRDQIRARLADADGLLCCLDFDGTLAPIVADPDDAELHPDAADPVRDLAATPAVTVAVVSGRAIDDLRGRVGVDGVRYAGNHGLEHSVDGERTVLPEARDLRKPLARAVETLRAELADVPGCEVEDKALTATVHYRRVPDDRVGEVRDAVERAVADREGLEVTAGKQILEVRPAVDCDKGRAVDRLREVCGPALPMYVGDDVTDEDAFRAVADEGIGVHVGDDPETAADVRVADPADCAAFLDWLAGACERHLDGDPDR